MSEKKVPEVRFRRFREEWENNLFGDCVLIQRGGSPRPIENFMTNDENGINWIKIGDVSVGSRYITKTAEKIIPEGEKCSRKVYRGDLILSNSMSFGRPYIMAIDGCIHDGWLLIRDEQKKFDIEYLQQMLSSTHMLIQYKSLASGGVVNNLNSELVQSTTICYPKIDEQTKIGEFFKNLDDLIAQNQKKYDKLVNIKKACLDKMFPKDGADTPEVRFRGFSGEWVNDTLGEITDVYDGTHQTPKYTESGIMFLSVENIKTLHSEKYISEDDFLNDFKIFPQKNDVLMTRIGDIGTANVVDSDTRKAYYVSLALLKYKKLNPYFLRESIHSKTVKREIWHRTLHIAFPKKINKNEIEKVNILFPNETDEQTKIGTFFQTIDRLITLRKTELDKLKNIKKACLDKMFI